MKTLALITALVFLIYIAIYEGVVLKMKDAMLAGDLATASKADRWRHGWSTILRMGSLAMAFAFVYPFSWNHLWVLFLMISLSWTAWNMILNGMRGKSIWYKGSVASGTNSVLDQLLSNVYVYWGLQGAVLVCALVSFLVFNL